MHLREHLDDAVNVHGFYFSSSRRQGRGSISSAPERDVGLTAGDEIETCDRATFRSLGRSKVTQLTRRHAPELKARIAQLWKAKSPTTQPDLVYDVVLGTICRLTIADAVTSPSRVGSGTSHPALRLPCLRPCDGRSPNSVVEDCQFSYASRIALQAGSDIGFWSRSGFAENTIFRNNRFTHSITGASGDDQRQRRSRRHLCSA